MTDEQAKNFILKQGWRGLRCGYCNNIITAEENEDNCGYCDDCDETAQGEYWRKNRRRMSPAERKAFALCYPDIVNPAEE